jgi:hypothetical protein
MAVTPKRKRLILVIWKARKAAAWDPEVHGTAFIHPDIELVQPGKLVARAGAAS